MEQSEGHPTRGGSGNLHCRVFGWNEGYVEDGHKGLNHFALRLGSHHALKGGFRLSDTLSKAGRSIEILDMAEIKTSRISSILESDWSMSFRISFHSKETVAIPF